MSDSNKRVVEAIRAAATPVEQDGVVRVFLSRRNLEILINKLDANKVAEKDGKEPVTRCTIVKKDIFHPQYPQTHAIIEVKAVEDEEYYKHRLAGVTKFVN